MTPRSLLLAAAFGFTASAACAEGDDFSALDLDNSNGLSLAEVQAAAPYVTADEFGKFDGDGSGELSKAEFASWKAASQGQQN